MVDVAAALCRVVVDLLKQIMFSAHIVGVSQQLPRYRFCLKVKTIAGPENAGLNLRTKRSAGITS